MKASRPALPGSPVSRCGNTDHLAGLGAVPLLEARLAEHWHLRHALCVPSATTGLLGVGLALELRGAEFVTTPYTYGGTIAAWLTALGARPVFADIDPATLTLSPSSVASSLTRKTRAILVADIFGVPADHGALRRIADESGTWLVGDAAQSFGATRDGIPASSLCHVLVTSFTHGKALQAGEGGAVLTVDPEVWARLVWHTQHPARQKLLLGPDLFNELGVNGRIHPWAAGQALHRFDAALAGVRRRQEAGLALARRLDELGFTEPLPFSEGGILPSFHRFTAALKDPGDRPRLADALSRERAAVVLTDSPVTPIYRQASFRAAGVGRKVDWARRCPCTEAQQARRVVLQPARDG